MASGGRDHASHKVMGGRPPAPYGDDMATTVYVDGFKLYFGALKGTRYKWLDSLMFSPTSTVRSGSPKGGETQKPARRRVSHPATEATGGI